jgi:hypothetical protein
MMKLKRSIWVSIKILKIKIFFIFFLSSMAFADSDPLYITVSYYDSIPGQRFRIETASNWPKCKENKRARKLFLDKPNELREIGIWRKNGKFEEAGRLNLEKLLPEVEAIFAQSQSSGNPCVLPPEAKPKGTGEEPETPKATVQ